MPPARPPAGVDSRPVTVTGVPAPTVLGAVAVSFVAVRTVVDAVAVTAGWMPFGATVAVYVRSPAGAGSVNEQYVREAPEGVSYGPAGE